MHNCRREAKVAACCFMRCCHPSTYARMYLSIYKYSFALPPFLSSPRHSADLLSLSTCWFTTAFLLLLPFFLLNARLGTLLFAHTIDLLSISLYIIWLQVCTCARTRERQRRRRHLANAYSSSEGGAKRQALLLFLLRLSLLARVPNPPL
jgi:hypothetical protein